MFGGHKKGFSIAIGATPPSTRQLSDIPLEVFHRLCEFIKMNFLDTEGLFRVSGAVDEVRLVREKLAKDPKIPLTTTSSHGTSNAHTYSSVLTSYLREQPTSLLPFTMYDDLCKAQATYVGKCVAAKPDSSSSTTKSESGETTEKADIPPPQLTKEECCEQGLKLFKECIDNLPARNRLLLHALIDLLFEVDAHSESNKMSANNLGVVFGPTLVKKENEDLMSIMTMTDRCDIVATIIRNAKKLFPNPVNPQHYSEGTTSSSSSLLRQSTKHHMTRGSTSFSSNKVHDKWFESFPGFQSARTLLAQAEAVVETQMAAESEAQKRLARQTVDPQTFAVAMKLSAGGASPTPALQKELEEAREQAHRSSLALSQVIIKLVEIIREKAALEDENAQLYLRLENEMARKNYFSSSSKDGEDGHGGDAAKNFMVANEIKRVEEMNSEDFAFEPQDVLHKLDVLQTRMVHGCEEVLPPSIDKTLVAVSNTVKRSADIVQTLQSTTGSGADFVKQLLDESSAQLQTIAKDLSSTRTRMATVAEREIGATAHAIMAYACGEEESDAFDAKTEEEKRKEGGSTGQPSDMSKAMALLGITITHVDDTPGPSGSMRLDGESSSDEEEDDDDGKGDDKDDEKK